MNTLAICLPTNRLRKLKKYFLTGIQRLAQESPELPEYITVCYNFQGQDYSQEVIDSVVNLTKSLGYSVEWMKGEYPPIQDGFRSMIQIRHETCMLGKDSKVVVLMDDDQEFLEGYGSDLISILGLFDDPEVGMVCGKHNLANKAPVGERDALIELVTRPKDLLRIWNSTGLFIRNLLFAGKDYQAYPNDTIDLIGPHEEKVLTMHYSQDLGYKVLRYTTDRIAHHMSSPGSRQFQFNSPSYLTRLTRIRHTVLYYLLDRYAWIRYLRGREISHLVRNLEPGVTLLPPYEFVDIPTTGLSKFE